MLPVMAALALSRNGAATVPRRWRRGVSLALLGSIVSCLGSIPYFSVLSSSAKAATVVPVTALYPLATILLAVPLLKEQLNRVQLLGVALSLIAIYMFNIHEERELFSAWLLVALVPAVLWGIAGFLQKLSTNDVSGGVSALWFLSAFVPVGVVILVRQPLPPGISWWTLWLVIGLGFTLALGNFAVLVAYGSNGKASIITPLVALYPIVSIPIAILLFGERIGRHESLGVMLGIFSIAMLSWESPPIPSQSLTTLEENRT
jgi:bacterial/archaeal transporter family protein